MSFENLIYELRGHVAVLTMNRPDRRNALGGTLRQDFIDAFARAEADDAVRVIVLTGAGAGFCAGGDVKDFARDFAAGTPRPFIEKYAPIRDRMVHAIHDSTKPVIAAVNGAAAGAGMSLALAADIRYAADTASFSQAFVKRGVHPDFGASYFLPRIVGHAKAAELIFTGDLIDADEALRIGLVSRVLPAADLMETVMALAERIAAGPPMAIRFAKQSLRECVDAPSLQAALDRETLVQNICIEMDDAREGMTAFVEKRAPVFHGR